MRRCAAVCAALVLLLLWPVSPAPGSGSTSLRIGVLREVERVSIVFDHPVALTAGPLVSLSLEPGAYEFVPRAAGIEVAGAGTRFENTIRLSPTEGGRLSIGIRPYRGLLELRRTPSGRLTVINEVDLEEYLYGVLKMEVDPEWPADALRAQAVAARTLAPICIRGVRCAGDDRYPIVRRNLRGRSPHYRRRGRDSRGDHDVRGPADFRRIPL